MKLVNFKGSQSWYCEFLQRSELSIRTRITVDQKLPEDWDMKKRGFCKVCQGSNNQKVFDTLQIINMNKVPLTFDCLPNKTVPLKVDKTVNIMTTEVKKCPSCVCLHGLTMNKN